MGIIEALLKYKIHAYILLKLSCGKTREQIERNIQSMMDESFNNIENSALTAGAERRLQPGE